MVTATVRLAPSQTRRISSGSSVASWSGRGSIRPPSTRQSRVPVLLALPCSAMRWPPGGSVVRQGAEEHGGAGNTTNMDEHGRTRTDGIWALVRPCQFVFVRVRPCSSLLSGMHLAEPPLRKEAGHATL